ncbi:MAG: hypothetical protein E7549_05700 [Ruminococcaceae bacterium]|nr:hypothetical protein [Oscillospiraceae bacterium]
MKRDIARNRMVWHSSASNDGVTFVTLDHQKRHAFVDEFFRHAGHSPFLSGINIHKTQGENAPTRVHSPHFYPYTPALG